MRLALLIAAAALLGGCQIDADYDGTAFVCPGGDCPSGYQCIDERCVRSGSADAGQDAGADAAPDAGECVCTGERFANDCGAGLEDLTGAGAPGGERVCASTAGNTNAVIGCNGAPQPGFDAAYRVSVTAGQTITATVRPEGFDASLYLVRDCSSTSCDVLADDVGVSGTETATLADAAAGDYFVIVDSPSGAGCYELVVEVTD